jgi:UDP-glucose 4-epimerase
MTILVTGGAGYIGSHTCVSLLEAGYDIAVLDNFSNSTLEAPLRASEIAGKSFEVYNVDLRDIKGVENVLAHAEIKAVIHLAGLKAVGESVQEPLMYYNNNLTGTIVLCEAMAKYGVKNLVFSSSATVYGMQTEMPLREDMPLAPINPYGRTKQMLEQMLVDLACANPDWSIALLRYFNPVGAHESGLIGESPKGLPNNLFPYITQVAAGILPHLTIYGHDYDTPDGTCIRDYIHVMDLSEGHVAALDYVLENTGVETFNLGTGEGYSVHEVLHDFEQISGLHIARKIGPRRPGDAPVSYADAAKARQMLDWQVRRRLPEMCADAWRWQSKNPNGYGSGSSED